MENDNAYGGSGVLAVFLLENPIMKKGNKPEIFRKLS
jgi:hypothetical protein